MNEKDFLKNNPDYKTNGNCYEIHMRMLMHRHKDKHLILCHGMVTGDGADVKGVRFGHAWLEQNNVIIFDHSNGTELTTTKKEYYKKGQIKEEEVVRYNFEQAAKKVLETEHYGSWE